MKLTDYVKRTAAGFLLPFLLAASATAAAPIKKPGSLETKVLAAVQDTSTVQPGSPGKNTLPLISLLTGTPRQSEAYEKGTPQTPMLHPEAGMALPGIIPTTQTPGFRAAAANKPSSMDRLYWQCPDMDAVRQTLADFKIVLINGDSQDTRWTNDGRKFVVLDESYLPSANDTTDWAHGNPFECDTQSPDYFTKPTAMVFVNQMEVLRKHEFRMPQPYLEKGQTPYEYMKEYTDMIFLSLYNYSNYGGWFNVDYCSENFCTKEFFTDLFGEIFDWKKIGRTIGYNLYNKTMSYWNGYGPDSRDAWPDNIWPYIYSAALNRHEVEHANPNTPDHECEDNHRDKTLDGSWGAQVKYLYWVYRHSTNDDPDTWLNAKSMARSILEYEFCEPVDKNPDPQVQNMLDDILEGKPFVYTANFKYYPDMEIVAAYGRVDPNQDSTAYTMALIGLKEYLAELEKTGTPKTAFENALALGNLHIIQGHGPHEVKESARSEEHTSELQSH